MEAVGFCGCTVFWRLFACGIQVFLHMPYMALCRGWRGVDVNACIDWSSAVKASESH
jgi:hypothetical protein